MRLTAIKLAGFKSFVDPTTFQAPTNLTGIVGPNGCGKSNIIDAVRWVMGEGSARVLRGELMSDVIFSGSSTRKPVGTATVELVFDNTDGKVGGEFARFNEISVKRTVARDGLSTYTLNGTRCRRKDIRDLFLGTGLGSKSYSIIEQGMISQVVEAKPEEVRGHLEEAAGISRYKERRRETESRIRHTRDNLDRLADLRQEVSAHLDRLKRQARAAERYAKLKQQRRQLRARLLALQWRDRMEEAGRGKEQLKRQETQLEALLAGQRAAEKELEKIHVGQAEAVEAHGEVQAEMYAVGSDIARLEQTIRHQKELQQRQQKEYEEVSSSLNDLEQHMVLDRVQVEQLANRLAELEPSLEQAIGEEAAADGAMSGAEGEVSAWQEQLEEQFQEARQLGRTAEGLKAQVEVLDQRMASAARRVEELKSQGEGADTTGLAESVVDLERQSQAALEAEDRRQAELDRTRLDLADSREALRESRAEENRLQSRCHTLEGRLEALRSLQQAASADDESKQWLSDHGLAEAPRLLSAVHADQGWETAVETVLGEWLEFVLAGDARGVAPRLHQLESGSLGVLLDSSGKVRPRAGSLAEKVQAPDVVMAQLNHVMVAESLAEALDYFEGLEVEESAITREGEWIGHGWARIARAPNGQSGLLAREQEILQLQDEIGRVQSHWQKAKADNERLSGAIREREESLEALQKEVNDLHRRRSELEGRLASERDRIGYLDQRGRQIADEVASLVAQQQSDGASVRERRVELEAVLEAMARTEEWRRELDQQRGALVQGRDQARSALHTARERRHGLELDTRSHRASLDSLRQSLERMDSQVNQLQQRYLELSEQLAGSADPEQEHREEMDGLLARRIEVEQRLAASRARTQDLEARYREQDGLRLEAAQKVDDQRGALERARLGQQEIELAARELGKQVEEEGEDVAAIAAEIPENADSGEWQEEIERLSLRITRLEPVNLAAIQEYEEELKRKEYLDAQNEDLSEALVTLENAIAKIDRKTRTRFKDTFEMVNKGIQDLFPRLFGGGHAYLEMTGDDPLTTGVSIMARPPGKRVSSIHLLSGGEKALTAVAFVFAIFRLNPAPFCLLDEVDAPLDDANVGRFSDMVKEMSEKVQFIVVTHNKITMEMVNQLSGVTMREPGVSRLVQVDLEEAAGLAGA